ncbi:PR domain zinc finger protein 15-like isoform X2 [Portunus trituberculatus]|uniref:PR domain zinc finger protein 15-like isoform X2 n=1 Tax=Portunus trituberculatus TaxID=210409 RepID=UPI001E1CC161|nr:PR domain zinc finger protein 15-like isoform X2 [Portunus trituberculatus]
MREASGGVCDLCGDDHPAASCVTSSQPDFQSKSLKHHETQLAYQSLPPWVEVQEGAVGRQVVVREQICHKGGGHTFLDLSRKWLCNWLSLIPIGSSSNRNLLVCQIDDLIYYVSTENIPAGSELVVWYAPFYQPRIQKELEEVGSPHSLVGTAVVTQKVIPSGQPPARKKLVVAPSLARIVVGQGEVTFTHYSVQHNESDCHLTHELTDVDGKCDTNVTQGHAAITELPTLMLHDFPPKKYLQGKKTVQLCTNQPPQVSSGSSIQLAAVREDSTGPECVVRLTITAASEADEEQALMGDDTVEDMPLPLPSDIEGSGKLHSTVAPRHRKKYRKLNGHRSGVCVAESDMVKQLPPRALGARDPRPWNCTYCGQPYTCLLTFTKHLKAHLLWLVGRCHVCEECGLSLSSAELLQRHQQSGHPCTDLVQSAGSIADKKAKVMARRRIKPKGSNDEVNDKEEDLDDPDEDRSHSSLNKIPALPTKPIEGPHNCQICTKSFDKPQYLLRHLRKHSGDFTCQLCLKVFARKESLLKHLCPGEGQEASLSCPVCGRTFLNPQLLHQHHLKHQGSKKCERCGRVVSSQGALQRHMATCPSVQVTKCYQCEVCGKQLASVKQLESHKAHHRQQHHCHLCNKSYSNPSYLARHLPLCRQSHQLFSLGHVACEDCGKEFTDASAFRTHHHTHTHPFKCSACNHRFQTRVGFEIHVCEVEQQCDQCGTNFRSLQALNRHAAVHGPPPYSCKACRRSYYRKESLDRHNCNIEAEVKETSQTKEENLHTCNMCGAQLATRHSLTTHLRSVHGQSNGKVLTCETCGKVFHRRDLLQQHQAVHGPPSLPCPTCHKLFKTPKSLEVHSLIHLNIKRFSCKYCSKKFHQKVNLIRHERSHLPRGTVKCQYCATHCSSTEELKAHLLSHTLSQEDQEEQPQDGVPLTLIKKEAHDIKIEEAREVLLPQFTSHTVVDPQLKFVPGSKNEFGGSQTMCDPGHVLDANSGLQGDSDELKIIVKERTASRLKAEINKVCPAVVSGFRTKVVHSVVPVMASELTLQAAAVPHSDVASQSAVFLPQRISSFSLAAGEAALPAEYLVPTSPPTSAPSPHHIGNSSVFKVTNDSLNTEGCRLPSNVLITSATVSGLDDTEDCHLGASEECHETAETDHEVHLPSSSKASKVRHLTLSPGSDCLYQPTPVTATPGAGGTHVHDCHVLSGEQIVQSVVLVAEPPVTGC